MERARIHAFSALLALSALASLLTVASPASTSGERMPAPASTTYIRGTRESRDDECRTCHADVARGHDASLHARSFSDASFAKGYAQEPLAFCRGCHAPESAARDDVTPDAFASARGVTCVTCHVTSADGAVLASADRPTKRADLRSPARASAPHAINRVADFGTRACASCHEFAFVGAEHDGPSGLMQKTISEHAAAPPLVRDQSCASCHMKRGDSANGTSEHAFTVSRDEALLARSVDVRAERGADGVARIFVTAKGMGHAFPTGDLFRRIVLRAHTPRGTIERVFGRNFRAKRNEAGNTVRFESLDTRLRPSETSEVALGRAPISWELTYERVTGVGQTPPFNVDIESATVLAHGEL